MENEENSKAPAEAPESSQRRTSERTRGKRVCYNETLNSKNEQTPPKKRSRTNQKVPKPRPVSGVTTVEVGESSGSGEIENVRDLLPGSEGGTGLAGLGLQLEEVRNSFIEGSGSGTERSAHYRVKEALRTFNKHYLHLIQEEEKRCKQKGSGKKKAAATPRKKTKSKSPDLKATKKVTPKASRNSLEKAAAIPGEKNTSQRPDLKAVTKMRDANQILYPTKQIGSIPGVDVGHQFFSRAEMVIVGFHQHWLNGIDFISETSSKGIVEYRNYKFPLAVSIVLSGQYEDDLDNSEDVVYTGQGGHDLLGNKKQMKDQVMATGNLALKNSMLEGLPVRVIRGHRSKNSYVGKVYTYDGLYKVVNYWAEKGVSGFTVFKFRMKRLDDQPVLTTNQVHFIGGRAPQSLSEVRGLVCNDISGGLEEIPIPATNLVDEPPVPPSGFKYCKSIQVTDSVKIPASTIGCGCIGGCVDPHVCSCARLNNSDFPYVHRDGGRLVEAKAVVFECGPKCTCGPSCVNRTSQKGLRYRFEVFRTPKKGWGVRSWDFIPSGAPVCEYVGVLRRSDEVDSVSENYFIFDIDCLQTMNGLDGRQMRLRDVSLPANSLLDETESVVDSQPEFCIDAGEKGNLARFINHSCEPNLFVQCVLSSHHDIKLARVVLFAADNIPPLQELTYDYGYPLDSVSGPDGKPKQMACYCGAEGCRKRLF